MTDEPMRDRLILPILIPVGALAFILFLALTVSWVFLNVPAMVAVAIASALAFNLLIAFSISAARPDGGRALTGVLASVALVPLVIGGAAASGMVNLGDAPHDVTDELPVVNIAADNLQFDTEELLVPAGVAFTLRFDNQEDQPHNVAILESQGSTTVLFRGQIFNGPQVVDENVEPIPAGEYYFLCDVHPTMNGVVIADSNGAEAETAEEA